MLALRRLKAAESASVLGRCTRHMRATAPVQNDIELLAQLLKAAKEREAADAAKVAAATAGEGPKFQIKGFNALSKVGLDYFEKSQFILTGSAGELPPNIEEEPHAILLRSHKMQGEEVPPSVRAIARCGAGTNNIPIDLMSQRGIPVFNTPGANANSVKELVLRARRVSTCGLLLASRGIVEGVQHVNKVIVPEENGDHKAVAARIEKDKKHFGGRELVGKTLAIAGLGNIGCLVADAALSLGMNVVGYDPKISVDAAWRVPREVHKAASLEDAFSKADYVSINMPYIKNATHHAVSEEVLAAMHSGCHILNFSRAEIVDGGALKKLYDAGHKGKYICDFADQDMQGHPNFLCIPHLGASTDEAEDNCAMMAAKQIVNFLERGEIVNSVNFPTAKLERQDPEATRMCIINQNVPGALGLITTLLGDMGVNISQQLNTSRDEIAYNVIDMSGFPKGQQGNDIQRAIQEIECVISTRIIFTGSVQEGPANFFNREYESKTMDA